MQISQDHLSGSNTDGLIIFCAGGLSPGQPIVPPGCLGNNAKYFDSLLSLRSVKIQFSGVKFADCCLLWILTMEIFITMCPGPLGQTLSRGTFSNISQ